MPEVRELLKDPVVLITAIIMASAIGEAIIEFICSPIVDLFLDGEDPKKLKVRTVVFNLLSAGLGVIIAVNFNISLFKLWELQGKYPLLDPVLTGILLGRGSNATHAFLEKFVLAPKAEPLK